MKRIIVFLLVCTMLAGCSPSPTKSSYSPTAPTKSVLERNREIQSEAEDAYRNGEDYWSSVKPNYQPVDKNCVYWVKDGYAYHSARDCVALLRSKEILHGTLQEAFRTGHDHPCSKCVGN